MGVSLVGAWRSQPARHTGGKVSKGGLAPLGDALPRGFHEERQRESALVLLSPDRALWFTLLFAFRYAGGVPIRGTKCRSGWGWGPPSRKLRVPSLKLSRSWVPSAGRPAPRRGEFAMSSGARRQVGVGSVPCAARSRSACRPEVGVPVGDRCAIGAITAFSQKCERGGAASCPQGLSRRKTARIGTRPQRESALALLRLGLMVQPRPNRMRRVPIRGTKCRSGWGWGPPSRKLGFRASSSPLGPVGRPTSAKTRRVRIRRREATGWRRLRTVRCAVAQRVPTGGRCSEPVRHRGGKCERGGAPPLSRRKTARIGTRPLLRLGRMVQPRPNRMRRVPIRGTKCRSDGGRGPGVTRIRDLYEIGPVAPSAGRPARGAEAGI